MTHAFNYGTGPTRLTNIAGLDLVPDWQPLVAVGGIVQLMTAPGAPPAASEDSKDSIPLMVVVGVGTTVVLAASGWYARRRWLR